LNVDYCVCKPIIGFMTSHQSPDNRCSVHNPNNDIIIKASTEH